MCTEQARPHLAPRASHTCRARAVLARTVHTPLSLTLTLALARALALALTQARAWRPDLSVALNAIDFRGGLPFVYYHQVVSSVECPTVPLSYYQRAKLEASQVCARSSKCQSATTTIRGEPVAKEP